MEDDSIIFNGLSLLVSNIRRKVINVPLLPLLDI
jgi:hypothetical protein